MQIYKTTQFNLPAVIGKPFTGAQATVTAFQKSFDENGVVTNNPLVFISSMTTTLEYAIAYAETILRVCAAVQAVSDCPNEISFFTPSLQSVMEMPF